MPILLPKAALMHNFPRLPSPLETTSERNISLKSKFLSWSASFLLGLGMTASVASVAQAASPETAPRELTATIEQIETAANRQSLQEVMQYYSPNFVTSDGLDYTGLSMALTELWQNARQLSYDTQLQSWEQEGNEIVAETVTKITGVQQLGDRPMQLETTLRSRQRLENGKIVSQEILAERTTLKAGENPPEVTVNLPEQVKIGQRFHFDAIVKEPLGDDLLLGTAIEETVSRDRFFQPTELELDLLQSGGLFKVGRAPLLPDNRWISAVLVRNDGMTIVTQRLRVVEPNAR